MTGEAPFYIGPVERALSYLCDRVIAVSEFERRHALELGVARTKVVVVPNGVAPYQPLARSEARSVLGIAEDAFAIGFVGRLAPQKNPLDAIAAVTQIAGAQLVVIGDGELREAAEEAARDSASPVIFAGPRHAKPLFSAFDCLLCTSLYEGMPVSFLEALDCGVPLISYPVGGTEELVVEGATGFVTDPNPNAAAAALERLAARGTAERAQMADACRAKAAEYSETAMGERTLAVYENILKRRG